MGRRDTGQLLPVRGCPHAKAWRSATRDYNPALRTWIQTDQYLDPMMDLGLSVDPLTNDRTLYAGGNPVNMIDEDGHIPGTGGSTFHHSGGRTYVSINTGGPRINYSVTQGASAAVHASIRQRLEAAATARREAAKAARRERMHDCRGKKYYRWVSGIGRCMPRSVYRERYVPKPKPAKPKPKPGGGAQQGLSLNGGCVSGGFTIGSVGGEGTFCVARVRGDWTATLTGSGGPGGGTSGSVTVNGLWSNASTPNDLRGWCVGGGASGGYVVAANSDVCLSPSGITTVASGVGLGGGFEGHGRYGYTLGW